MTRTRTMYAHTSTQGTAIGETALCGAHRAEGSGAARAAAEVAGDWDGRSLQDCGSNDNLQCLICGYPRWWGACGVPECPDCLPRFDADNQPI